jgi:hypothetical protein
MVVGEELMLIVLEFLMRLSCSVISVLSVGRMEGRKTGRLASADPLTRNRSSLETTRRCDPRSNKNLFVQCR